MTGKGCHHCAIDNMGCIMIALVAWAQLKDSKMSTLFGSIIVTVPDEVAVVISQYMQLSACSTWTL